MNSPVTGSYAHGPQIRKVAFVGAAAGPFVAPSVGERRAAKVLVPVRDRLTQTERAA
jgi:hypothetical protein